MPAKRSLKSQMKRADASGAEFAVIIGETELASDSAAVKPLRATLRGRKRSSVSCRSKTWPTPWSTSS